jgi:serine/threonine protein kinase
LKILNCQPGPKCYLDYSKSDLWASGSLFYEFFSQSNPFFHGKLQQDNYDDEKLPSISSITSPILERLIHSILRKNPEKVFKTKGRADPEIRFLPLNLKYSSINLFIYLFDFCSAHQYYLLVIQSIYVFGLNQ